MITLLVGIIVFALLVFVAVYAGVRLANRGRR